MQVSKEGVLSRLRQNKRLIEMYQLDLLEKPNDAYIKSRIEDYKCKIMNLETWVALNASEVQS